MSNTKWFHFTHLGHYIILSGVNIYIFSFDNFYSTSLST